VCRNGVVVASWQEAISIKDMSLRAKQIFIKYQSQEVYMSGAGELWLIMQYTFQVTKSGMHPTSVRWYLIKNESLPADMRMKMLVGAL
jgi:hypothetical protein